MLGAQPQLRPFLRRLGFVRRFARGANSRLKRDER